MYEKIIILQHNNHNNNNNCYIDGTQEAPHTFDDCSLPHAKLPHTFPKNFRRTSLLMSFLRTFLWQGDADKRNNYVKNYMALLNPETMPRFLCLSLPLPLLELALLCANLQIYMQRSCSIKSSKPDHKQGYFMCASCPFLGTGLE